jgi:TonB-linked SusC/RagA family outer membrane protein
MKCNRLHKNKTLLRMKKSLLLFLLCCCIGSAYSQTVTIKGKITDDAGNPLPGVSVIPKGAKVGTQTNDSGIFRLQVKPATNGKTELALSHIGFAPQTVTVDGKNDVSVRLEKSLGDLEDVVVIGYGTAKRKDLTGTVSSISGTQIEKIPVSNIAEALTGRLPGVQVTTVDGQPGAEVVIRVRGGGSITGSNDPLYIVDGFRVTSLNDISPADIASIDVLKDAATAAIYGAAGANGVVIVTTKSPKGGKTTINYNGYWQARQLPKQLEVLSPYEFVLMQYEYARISSQSAVDNFSKYFGTYGDLELYKYQKGTNWQDVLFGSPAYSQQHSINLTGGTDKTKFAFTYTNNKDNGLLPTNSYLRDYFNFKLNHEVSKKLKFDLAARFTQAITNGTGTAGGGTNVRIGDGITTRPVNGLADVIEMDPGTSSDDYEQFLNSRIDPLELSKQDYRKRITQVLNLNLGGTWQINRNFSFRSEFTYAIGNSDTRRYYGPLTGTSRNEGGNLPMGEITQGKYNDVRWANTLNYTLKRTKHDLSVLLGQEIIALGKGFEAYNRAKYFNVDVTPEKMFATMGLGTPDLYTTTDVAPNKTSSFFGRAIYQFDRKYIFNFTARYDGSSKFSPDNQWEFFPAGSVAWRISAEDFMKNVKFVSDLKLRVSMGKVGNNNIGSDQWRVLFAPSSTRPYGAGDIYNPYYTYANNQLPNPKIKWETTITRNIGLDFTLFGNRLNGTLEVYKNTTQKLLVLTSIPPTTGFTSQQTNIGQTSNKGVELSFTWAAVSKKDFQLSFNFNIGMNRSNIDELGGPSEMQFNSNWASTDLRSQDDYRLYVGKTVGLVYGYVTDGMYTVDDFDSYNSTTRTYVLKAGVPTVALGGISTRPGTLKLKDLNGDGIINAENDRTIIGSTLPKTTGGFGVNTAFKGFDLGLFFNWVTGNQVYNTGKISYNMLYRTTYGNILNTSNYDNRFHYIDAAGNQVTGLKELAILNPNPTMWTPFSMGSASPWVHSWAIEDGSFLRLNTVSLGYSLPSKWISKVYMTKCRLYATVYNAWLFTSYSGYDPEVSTNRSTGYSQLTPGADYSAFPKSRSFTVGVNVSF